MGVVGGSLSLVPGANRMRSFIEVSCESETSWRLLILPDVVRSEVPRSTR